LTFQKQELTKFPHPYFQAHLMPMILTGTPACMFSRPGLVTLRCSTLDMPAIQYSNSLPIPVQLRRIRSPSGRPHYG